MKWPGTEMQHSEWFADVRATAHQVVARYFQAALGAPGTAPVR